jgi:hypothetical protein
VAGSDAFLAALAALGFKTERRGDLVVVELEPPLGPAAGTIVEVGADPPTDFPRIPPHWVHLPVRFDLPGGSRTPSELGPDWSKWSRPHKRWSGGPGAHEWLAHTHALLAAAAVVT